MSATVSRMDLGVGKRKSARRWFVAPGMEARHPEMASSAPAPWAVWDARRITRSRAAPSSRRFTGGPPKPEEEEAAARIGGTGGGAATSRDDDESRHRRGRRRAKSAEARREPLKRDAEGADARGRARAREDADDIAPGTHPGNARRRVWRSTRGGDVTRSCR